MNKHNQKGEIITLGSDGKLLVPPFSRIPFVEGDGIGKDVTPVMLDVVNAAVSRAYRNQRGIVWIEAFIGEKAQEKYGEGVFLPDEEIEKIRRHKVAIKGPLTTPVGGGISSLNVAIRQRLDLFACIRPIRHFSGVQSPVRDSKNTDMIIFRENTEDIYAGIEWAAETPEVKRVLSFLQKEMKVNKVRFPDTCGIGIKPVSRQGSERLISMALEYAVEHDRESVTLVHKGNIMKFTEGAFCKWGYDLADRQYQTSLIDDGPWRYFKNPRSGKQIILKDIITDNFFQQILLKPWDYDVIATLNLNGDYISDALAAQVGGIGIAPGANVSKEVAVFEATHGSAPKHAGKNRVNPGSMILSAEMMLRYMGWDEAANCIIRGIGGALASKYLTYDLARVQQRSITPTPAKTFGSQQEVAQELDRIIPGATLVSTTDFGKAIVDHM